MTLTITPKTPWKARRRQPERNLHAAVAAYLDNALPPTAFWYPVPSGAHMKPQHAAMLSRTGQLKAGIPDLCIVYLHRAVFIELKSPKGVLSDDQKRVHGQLTLAGAVVAVCRSVEDVAGFLMNLQIPLKGRIQ